MKIQFQFNSDDIVAASMPLAKLFQPNPTHDARGLEWLGWPGTPHLPPPSGDLYAKGATWLGLFEAGELISCLRHSGRVAGSFEIEGVYRLPRFLREAPNVVEVSHIAVRPGEENEAHLTNLLRFSREVGVRHSHTFHFVAGAYPHPGRLLVDGLGMQIHGTPLVAVSGGSDMARPPDGMDEDGMDEGKSSQPIYLYYMELG